jgi:ribosomal protein L11 methyltransferase
MSEMNYVKFSFSSPEPQTREILVAALAELEFEGFEEEGDCLHAYIPETKVDTEAVTVLSKQYAVPFEQTSIPRVNWNAQWEADFQPVVIESFCTIRASFHNMEVTTPHEIVITPKMSFGTGHHDTTQLMIGQMQYHGFEGQRVFDFGTGTGILAILAEKLGAGGVYAIDNDEWAYENARENAAMNGCTKVILAHGSLETMPDGDYDVILANINRHILLMYMDDLYGKLKPGGRIFMSGILREDETVVRAAAEQSGFSCISTTTQNNWLVMVCERKPAVAGHSALD